MADRFPSSPASQAGAGPSHRPETAGSTAAGSPDRRALIADDEAVVRKVCAKALELDHIPCDEAENGARALEAIRSRQYDVVLLDINMPEMTGPEVLRHVRQTLPDSRLKVIMFSGRAGADELAQMMLTGADDYLVKPFSMTQLRARVATALRRKDTEERFDALIQHGLVHKSELEQNLTARENDLARARHALVLALTKVVENRDTETGAHLTRLQHYSRILAEEAACTPGFASQIDMSMILMLECCAPLHDIGKAGLPDHILLKPGGFNAEERAIMQTHAILGAEVMQQVANQYNFDMPFLEMAICVARHHHERYDGTGYPDRLAGTDIPLCARLLTVGDVYDALRSRRVYKPALPHSDTMQVMLKSPGQFDPALLEVFRRCAPKMERVFRELTD